MLYHQEGDISAVRAVPHAVRARCIGFPRARTTFSFPLCCFGWRIWWPKGLNHPISQAQKTGHASLESKGK